MSKMEAQTEAVGTFIRQQVIPKGITVTEAAKQLHVGRPALSNLLNGKASLSPDMALRLEKTFGADRQDLLERQAKSDRERRTDADRAVAVTRFVPPFLTIKAWQIEEWANTIKARHLLPVLVRKLIHSTGEDLGSVDFPGYDNAQRRGWDGWVEANAATPWIPHGTSGWEFGVSKDARSKADDDYAKRMSKIPPTERALSTFVFVTPRNWKGKTEWEKTKSATGDWQNVRAFDASDLEQWLEQSIAAQIWLADQLPTPIPMQGCETLDRFWDRWRAASDPPMSDQIFAPSIEAHVTAFQKRLRRPADGPLSVAAGSAEEAVAFLACLFRHPDILRQEGDRAVHFKSAATLRTLASSTSPFIAVVSNEEAERELAPVYRRFPCIVVRPRNAVERPDIELELVGHQAFQRALGDMGVEAENHDRLARESGRSPTVLRRRLSKIAAIQTPLWAKDQEVARSLVPIALIGAWSRDSAADKEVVATVADCRYESVEEVIMKLQGCDDCPLWSAGPHRGVVSKLDALFAISTSLRNKDIDSFLNVTKNVLSESDPALELPEDQRWGAGWYGKVREHSAALRAGVCETLVLLVVHGDYLLQNGLAGDVKDRVGKLIRQLLTPLTLDKVLSNDNEFPLYAEAAPGVFLGLIEEDLRQPVPVVLGLLKPAESELFVSPRRFGLLRALECLSWSEQYLPHASRILAHLARTNINDNWWPKPTSSLAAIYHAWVPQTAAPLDHRIRGVEMLVRDFPEIGWDICIQQIEPGSSSHFNYRPRWRDWASGFGRGISETEERRCRGNALDCALAWPEHDQNTLGDLVAHLMGLSENDRSRVWDLVNAWARTATDDQAKANLRDRIHRCLLSPRRSTQDLTESGMDTARAVFKSLTSSDPVIRHGWLFAKPWIAPLYDETEDNTENEDDGSKHLERLRQRRSAAIGEIWAARGWEGVTKLLADGDAADVVGSNVAPLVTGQAVKILQVCLSSDAIARDKLDRFMQGFIASVEESERPGVLLAVAKNATPDQAARLFRCAPLGAQTWRLLDQQPTDVRDQYWNELSIPYWRSILSDCELAELVDSLLVAGRPYTAFRAVDWAGGRKVETSRLKRLLTALTTVSSDPADSYPIDPHDLSDALDALDGNAGVSPDEMASLELAFVEALGRRDGEKGHGIPNLERAVADSPGLFAQAVALAYRRNDDGQDPPGWTVEDADLLASAAAKSSVLLKALRRTPGADADGSVRPEPLRRWCMEVRRLCVEHGRADVGDIHIGQLLSHAPSDENGRWPCGAVCEVMEGLASPRIAVGFYTAVFNARGAHSRGIEDGGKEERKLAVQYRRFAEQLAFDYPYVSDVLERIAQVYDNAEKWHDSEASIRKRLGY